jgi:hypothetical protein
VGIEALTHDDAGNLRNPELGSGWDEWVSATATRNHVLNDPILDWLSLYGVDKGFPRDFEAQGYDPRTDFVQYIMRKGREFEQSIISHMKTIIPITEINISPRETRNLSAPQTTFEAMCRGDSAISQGVLWDAEHKTYGRPDLLIRSDVLGRLFPNSINPAEVDISAKDLPGGPWHYRVLDIKFSILRFSSSGKLRDTGGSLLAYKTQVFIYNRALGRLQGYLPGESYLLGRGWEQTIGKETFRGTNSMDRLGPVPQEHQTASRGSLELITDQSLSWIRKVRSCGVEWQLFPEPSTMELWPNMTSISDHPWHRAKQEIAARLNDLTLVWHVGVAARLKAHQVNVVSWTDPACDSTVLGITGSKIATTLDSILQTNRMINGPVLLPEQLKGVEAEWEKGTPVEFFVDFETVSDLDDDFTKIPEKGGQPLIFMIGCGYLENSEWKWKGFTVDSLCEESEKVIINQWLSYMEQIIKSKGPLAEKPLVFHWSNAEQSTFESAFNSVKKRHPNEDWPEIRWYDFLSRVVRQFPIVVRGSFGFGLKSIATAMYNHGLINTVWGTGPTDGLGAMVGAWWSSSEAKRLNCNLQDIDLMAEILNYNEIDCKVMMEIVLYLRTLVVNGPATSKGSI